jgi:hypothetical protein
VSCDFSQDFAAAEVRKSTELQSQSDSDPIPCSQKPRGSARQPKSDPDKAMEVGEAYNVDVRTFFLFFFFSFFFFCRRLSQCLCAGVIHDVD